jgi:hypothetical protein
MRLHPIPNKINKRKFDGKYPTTLIFQMEQYFDLHQPPSLQKVPIASLYLENDVFVKERRIFLYLGPFLQMN